MGNKPIDKVWQRGFEITQWEEDSYTMPIKSYKDKITGEWKTSTRIFKSELPHLAATAMLAAEKAGLTKETQESLKEARERNAKQS
jgi:hypothetical protein